MTTTPAKTGEVVLVDISRGGLTLRERVWLDDSRRTFTIGRSLEADVVLDDPHAAGIHATVDVAQDGRVTVSDAGTANGVMVGGRRQQGSVLLGPNNIALQIGRTRLRIRTEHEPLAPELPDRQGLAAWGRNAGVIAAFAGAIFLGQLLYDQWVGAPRDLIATLPGVLTFPVAIAAGWIAGWGLLSRVVLGEWHWLRHAAIFFGLAALTGLIAGAVNIGSFALSVPSWATQGRWTILAAICAALGLHLSQATTLSQRRAALVAGAAFLVLGGTGAWLDAREKARNVNDIHARVPLYPDHLRLRPASPVDAIFQAAQTLKAKADQRRTQTLADDGDSGGSY